jgi:DNA modification methylase
VLVYGKSKGTVLRDWIDQPISLQSDVGGHPCPKPLKLMRQLVSSLSTDDGVVVDPFIGSGTTLRAAKDLGRKAIGIEIEERYCEIAAKRLGQEVLF